MPGSTWRDFVGPDALAAHATWLATRTVGRLDLEGADLRGAARR